MRFRVELTNFSFRLPSQPIPFFSTTTATMPALVKASKKAAVPAGKKSKKQVSVRCELLRGAEGERAAGEMGKGRQNGG